MIILMLSTESSVQMAFIHPLAVHLRRQGHQVVLACSNDTGEYGQSLVEPLRRTGFEVLVIPMRRTISPWRNLLAGIRLYRILRQRCFDVVHVQTAVAGMVGRIAARLARVPVVIYTAHAFPFHEYRPWWQIRLFVLLERLASHLCDMITVDSEYVRSRGLVFEVARPEKIRVIPMGVDTERFDPGKYRAARHMIRAEFGVRPGAIVLGGVGRFVPDKGWDVLLRTMSLLVKRFPEVDVQCLLVGGGELRETLQTLARTLNLDGRVIFANYQRDVPKIMAALDIYMLPTRREGFGVTFIEAMSMEVPVVTSRIPPLDKIIVSGRSGVLATIDAPDAFASAVEPLLTNAELRRQMGQAGRRDVIERFEQARMCGAYERLFLECLGR